MFPKLTKDLNICKFIQQFNVCIYPDSEQTKDRFTTSVLDTIVMRFEESPLRSCISIWVYLGMMQLYCPNKDLNALNTRNVEALTSATINYLTNLLNK